jgi:hypothetical protein
MSRIKMRLENKYSREKEKTLKMLIMKGEPIQEEDEEEDDLNEDSNAGTGDPGQDSIK